MKEQRWANSGTHDHSEAVMVEDHGVAPAIASSAQLAIEALTMKRPSSENWKVLHDGADEVDRAKLSSRTNRRRFSMRFVPLSFWLLAFMCCAEYCGNALSICHFLRRQATQQDDNIAMVVSYWMTAKWETLLWCFTVCSFSIVYGGAEWRCVFR